jgi:hypothetical protein
MFLGRFFTNKFALSTSKNTRIYKKYFSNSHYPQEYQNPVPPFPHQLENKKKK